MNNLNINNNYLNETNYKTLRGKNDLLKYIILHHTAWKNSINIFRGKNKKQVSIHYLIDKKWNIYHFIDENNFIAWHTWNSNKWPKEKTRWWRNLNPISIWIELENLWDWKDPYTKEQIDSLIQLTKFLKDKYNIEINNILWHKELTTRKIDPSDNFFKWWMSWFRKYLKDLEKWKETKTKKLEPDLKKIFNKMEEIEKEIKKLNQLTKDFKEINEMKKSIKVIWDFIEKIQK